MTRSTDLADWLLNNLTYQLQNGETQAIKQAVIEANLNTNALPAAVIEFKAIAPPDVLDGTQRYEQYNVALSADPIGNQGPAIARQLSQLEISLQNAALSAARFSQRWTHLVAKFIARKGCVAMWQIDLLVSGD